MSEVVSLSDELSDAEWLGEIAEIGDDRGYFEPIGRHHAALFIDESLDVLLVSFDTVGTARSGSASGIPHGMLQAEIHGWSHLSIIAKGPTWFRDPALYAYFDRLVDEAFFEDFDRVIFYGAGMGAYGAAAYSVSAPGSTVFLAAPVASLDPEVAPWDDRFVRARSKDFRSRYGYAPDMLEAAEKAFLIYDPTVELDAMHAALFRGAQIEKIRFRNAGTRIGDMLQSMNALAPLFRAAADDRLTTSDIWKVLRRRREFGGYLRALLARTHVEDRPFLTAVMCRSVLARHESERFRAQFEAAKARLTEEGRLLPPPRRKRRAADLLPELMR